MTPWGIITSLRAANHEVHVITWDRWNETYKIRACQDIGCMTSTYSGETLPEDLSSERYEDLLDFTAGEVAKFKARITHTYSNLFRRSFQNNGSIYFLQHKIAILANFYYHLKWPLKPIFIGIDMFFT